ncbi:MAG: Bug family tripartite tricarboxylate transporter substrate binding protein [Gemmatimonas sp.]|jgi:tripartite-type tricarboxylate transporter receptor subunit TctC
MLRTLAALAAAAFALAAAAQDFPTKPVTIVVPYSAGGSTDIVGRIMAEGASEVLRQPVIVENVAGASGNIGTARVARATPDGYTLVTCAIATCAINTSLYANRGFSIEKDFETVFYVGGVLNVLTVGSQSPIKSVAHLVEFARANPGKVSYGSSGVGSSTHLASAWLKTLTGTDLIHVPYKGMAPAILDLIGGHLTMLIDNEPSILPQVKGGKVRALAVAGPQRSAALPDVPTMEESGFKGFYVEPWFGFMVPKGTPKAAVDRLNAAFNAAIQNPKTRKKLEEAGLRPVGGLPSRLADQIKLETDRWAQVIRDNNIKVD